MSSLFAALRNDPTLSMALLSGLEKAINLALKYDPATQRKLASFDGVWLKLEISDLDFSFYFSSENQHVLLRSSHLDIETPDATITGEWLDFVKLQEAQHSFANSSIHVSGKSGVLNELQSISADLDIDWEQALTETLGVVPGHLLAQSLRATHRFAKQSQHTFESHFADYLTEELRAIPSSFELEAFYQEVGEIKSDVDRLEARLNTLLRHTQK